MLFVVPNRGLPTNAPWLKGGFLLDRGWTIASCGWQWDVQRGPAILGITAPEADVPPGWMRLEWRADAASDDHALSFSAPEIDSLPGAASPGSSTDAVDVIWRCWPRWPGSWSWTRPSCSPCSFA